MDVWDDSKVLNIDMVHANIMQVDITMEDMKEEESVRWKWIKSNDWRDIKVLNTSVHSSSQGLTQKKCKITLVRNPFWLFLKKSS